VISLNLEGPSTETVVIERSAPVNSEELILNYGEDFPAWEQQWTERMRRTPSGLTILCGPPGCGKTSYLRALMSRLLATAVFYFVPVSEAEMLSHPRFVSFGLRQTNRHPKQQKIAILEDAEELLLARDEGSRAKVSNLLNIADGFLGDHLKLHVIATTNVPLSKLDPAIARPGRLIGVREFRRLSRAEALRLADAKGLNLPDQSDFSLAELYCSRAVTDRIGLP
jgi:SpoVK/Ycf46/Vps4 family AAA+-type ATPase